MSDFVICIQLIKIHLYGNLKRVNGVKWKYFIFPIWGMVKMTINKSHWKESKIHTRRKSNLLKIVKETKNKQSEIN